MATNQAGIPVIMQGTVNPPINQNQRPVVGGQTDPQKFPVRTLKIFGSIQIGCGILIGILSIIGVVLDAIAMKENRNCNENNYFYDYLDDYNSNYYTYLCSTKQRNRRLLFAYDVTCIICSGWIIMTGLLPLFMSRKREKSWRGLRVGFMVCSIIGASLFMSTMFILGAVEANVRAIYNRVDADLSVFIAMLSFVEMVLAISAASYCCRCILWEKQGRSVQGTVMFMNGSQPAVFVNLPQTQIPMNYQPNVLMTTGQPVNPTMQYQRGQQYVVTSTNQPLNIQQLVPQQPLNIQQPERIHTDNPPESLHINR